MKPLALTLATLALFFFGPANAQTGEKKMPETTVSLIPVGSNSDAYWTGDGPSIRAIALDPGAAPPSTLCVRSKKGTITIPTILNRPSMAIPVKNNKLQVFANATPDPEGELPLFGEFAIPSTGHYDLFLNRDDKRKDWEKSQSMVLPTDLSKFPNGSFRVVNLCPEPIQIKIGTAVLTVGPRRALIHQPKEAAGKLLILQAVRKDGDSLQWILRTGMKVAADQRGNVVFYSGRSTKEPIKATTYYQSDPELAEVDPE